MNNPHPLAELLERRADLARQREICQRDMDRCRAALRTQRQPAEVERLRMEKQASGLAIQAIDKELSQIRHEINALTTTGTATIARHFMNAAQETLTPKLFQIILTAAQQKQLTEAMQ